MALKDFERFISFDDDNTNHHMKSRITENFISTDNIFTSQRFLNDYFQEFFDIQSISTLAAIIV